MMNELLKVVMLFWFYPLVFLLLILENYDHWDGILFRYIPQLHATCSIFFALWVCGALYMIARYIESNRILAKRYHKLVPVDGNEWECFMEICGKMGIAEGQVDLVQDYKARVPYLCGLKKQYVVLPVQDYTKSQLRVIFVHELTHYKQGAQVLRHLAAIAKAIHFFNPAVYLFQEVLDFWNEYACDYAAIPRIGSMRIYFEEILKTIQEAERWEEPALREEIESRLVSRKSQLLKRVEMMQKSENARDKSQTASLFVIACMLLLSVLFIHDITRLVGNRYVKIYTKSIQSVSVSCSDSLDSCFGESGICFPVTSIW